MAQKISPTANRLSINKNSESIWFDSINTEKAIQADILFRNFLYLLGTHLSKSNNSYIVRISLSSYHQNTHVECFIDKRYSDIIQNNSDTDRKTCIFSDVKHQDSFSLIPKIKNLTHSVSQKLCLLTFIQNYKKINNQICIPFNNKNYQIKFFQITNRFQSAALIASHIAHDITQGKSVNEIFSDICVDYTNNYKTLTFIKGFRIQCKGRITNTEEALIKTVEIGRIARGKLNEYVDYYLLSSQIGLGIVGIKVWINFNKKN